MGDEHDDDIEPEVTEGAEIEAESYPDIAEEIEDEETRGGLTDSESGSGDKDKEDAYPPVDDEASDTI